MINWRHPLKEKPKNGQGVFYIDWHYKNEIPGSYQIIGGTYTEYQDGKAFVEELDEHGGGCFSMPWPENEYDVDCNHVVAWVPAEEINLPDWL